MKLSKTYETWSIDTIEIGTTNNRGYEYKDKPFDSIADIVNEIMSEGSVEPSSSIYHRNIWYSSIDADVDYKTGDSTGYSFHPSDMTEDQERYLYNILTAK